MLNSCKEMKILAIETTGKYGSAAVINEAGEEILELRNDTKNESYAVKMPLTERQKGMILSVGLINFIRKNA